MNEQVKVDYADRELAPNGGIRPEDFAVYLEELCNRRAEEGYRLTSVLSATSADGKTIGAWLFFSWEEEPEPPLRQFEVGAAIETPQTLPGIQTFPPPEGL